MFLFTTMLSDCHGREDQGQYTEDKRLYDTQECLQSIEDRGKPPWYDGRYYNQQYLAGSHIAKKTEGKAKDSYKLTEQFKEAHDDVDSAEKDYAYSGFDFASYKLSQTCEYLPKSEKLAQIDAKPK
jgi:hypothetical protein